MEKGMTWAQAVGATKSGMIYQLSTPYHHRGVKTQFDMTEKDALDWVPCYREAEAALEEQEVRRAQRRAFQEGCAATFQAIAGFLASRNMQVTWIWPPNPYDPELEESDAK